MREIKEQRLTGERALFQAQDAHISYCVFEAGESPLKESRDLAIDNTLFKWKYPLWYSKNVSLRDCSLFDMARAGIWYTEQINVEHTVIEAPKNFRRSKQIVLRDVDMPNAAETLWNCEDVRMEQVTAKGDYFAMNCKNVVAKNFTLVGNYSFDGCRNVEIHDSRLLSKDAFWNAEHVTVYNSFISGEYLGWNSRDITLVDCVIESQIGRAHV